MGLGFLHPSFRTAARVGAALAIVCLGLLRGGVITAQAVNAVTFAELPLGTVLSTQYGGTNVTFPAVPGPHIDNHDSDLAPATTLPQVINKSFTMDPGSFRTTDPGGQVIMAPTCGCQQNYGVGPLTIDFTQPQQHVSLDAGFLETAHAGAPRTLVLTGWMNSSDPAGGNQLVAIATAQTRSIGPDNSITHHLSINAPAGAEFDMVTVDQTSPTNGTTATDSDFAIGKLSYTNPGNNPYKGYPPASITITSPADGATVYVNGPTLVGGVINAQSSQLPGGWHVDLAVYAPNATVPVVTSHVGKHNGVLPHIQLYGIQASLTPGLNKIELRLINGSGTTVSTDDVHVTVRNQPPAVDVVPRGMEITQAINRPLMDADSILWHPHKGMSYQGEPLVENKMTVVRLYPTVIGQGAQAVDYVGAQLSATDEGTGQPLPGSPITPQTGPTGAPDRRITVDPSLNAFDDRLYSAHSWSFVLPLSWTQSGRKITLVGQVNPDHTVPDPNTSDDTFTVQHVQFFQTSTIELRPRFFTGPVSSPYTSPSSSDYPGTTDSAFTDGFMNSLLPVPDGAPVVDVPPDPTITKCSGEGFLGLESGNCDNDGDENDFFSHLLSTAKDDFNSDNSGHAFDFNPPFTPYVIDESEINGSTSNLQAGVKPKQLFAIGMSDVPSHGIAAEVANAGDTTHETLHALGMQHASNAHGEAGGGGFEDWPYCHGEIAVLCSGDPNTSLNSVSPGVPDERAMGFNTAPRGGDLSDWSTARDYAVANPQNGVAIIKDPIAHAPYPGLEEPVDPGCQPTPSASAMHYHEVISYGASINPYCQNLGAWISDINYCRMFFTLSGLKSPDGGNGHDWCKSHEGILSPSDITGLGNQEAALLRGATHTGATANASPRSLQVSGVLDQNFQLQSLSFSPSSAPAAPAPKSGKYTAELVTKSGTTIKALFNVSSISTHTTPLESFSTSLPYPQGVQNLVILDPSNSELGRVRRPGWQPSLKILAPTGGSQTCNGFRLAWSFSNPASNPASGGVPVHFDVSVSNDGGKTFQAVAAGIQDTALDIPPGCSPGGTLTFRVTASDGFDQVSVNSAAVTLPQAAPTVTITSPSDGLTLQPGILATFTGQAEDANGNPIPGGSLRWVSDRDGVLGTGSVLDTNRLSVGTHHITLVATSAAGLAWSTTITVTVSHGIGTAPPG